MSAAQDNHLRSPEEDDLIYRSTKKIKDGNSEVMDVEKEAIVDEVTSHAKKVLNLILSPQRLSAWSLKNYSQTSKIPRRLKTLVKRLTQILQRVGFRMMSMKLKYLWAKNGDIRVMDFSEDFYLVRFSDEDYNVKKIAVWVLIPHLPAELYNPHFLWRAGSQLGTMLKIDETTSIHTCSQFARICIEVDLRYQLIPYFNALGRTFKVEYEGLHMICLECGKYGHKMDSCPDKIKSLEVKNQDSVVHITKAQEVKNFVQDSNGGRQEINVNPSITDVQEKDSSQQSLEEQAIFGPWMLVKKSPRKIIKVNSKKQEGGIEKPQGDQAHISGTRFEILSSDADQDCEVNMDNSQHGKKQTPKAQIGNQAGPSHTKIVVPKPVKHYNQNQKLLPGNSKKNQIPLKNQKKPVVSKDSQTKEESSSKNLSPKTVVEQEKKKDWENEILAMMSRYHSKIWESHSKGEYVGDPLSLDKNNYYKIMKGLDTGSSLGKSAILNLDLPPDTSEYRGLQIS
ncbi:Zinc finger, CCHC-type [Sesbania bispinosa]|nr:Zinc finger, CCHC-type [Sesbania bispinosa]